MVQILHRQINKDGSTTIVFPYIESLGVTVGTKTQHVVVATGRPPIFKSVKEISKDKLRETLIRIFEGKE